MIAQQLRLGRGRNVQHVKSMVVSMCQIDRSSRGDDRRRVIAYSRVVGDIVRAGESRPHWLARSFRLRSER